MATHTPASEPWSEAEVRLTIADYFKMLAEELAGRDFNKAAHFRDLLPQLLNRTKNAIEFKHQNISAILIERGLPYIDGYKPLFNYQALLAREVEAFLHAHPGLVNDLSELPLLQPDTIPTLTAEDLTTLIAEPPEKIVQPDPGKPWITRQSRHVDFVLQDANNRKLGQMAESFVVDFERARLCAAGRADLAQKIVWASKEIGDGLGFDIISFDERDESEKFVEVKATGLGKYFPFYVTDNEVRCSEDLPAQFHLYRLFNFSRGPRLYVLPGALSQTCRLTPTLYRAGI